MPVEKNVNLHVLDAIL